MNFKSIETPAAIGLAAACVIVFIAQNIGIDFSQQGAAYPWRNPSFQWWQLVSYLFLHGGLVHLAFNMIALVSFGRSLERVWGWRFFLFFYFACGIGAALIHIFINDYQFQSLYNQLLTQGATGTQLQAIVEQGQYSDTVSRFVDMSQAKELYLSFNTPMIGASGAIYGILIAFTLMFPNAKIILLFLPVPIAAKYLVPVLLLIDLSAGVTGFSIFGFNIAHFGHLGGALVGLIIMMCMRFVGRRRN